MNESDSNLMERIKTYIEEMGPDRKDYWQGGMLLGEAFDEIKRLQDAACSEHQERIKQIKEMIAKT